MTELGIDRFGEFLVGTIIIVLLPGPNSLFVITTSARHGWRSGVKASLGIFAGDTILILATAFGAATLIALFPEVFAGFKVLGAAYLAWVGFQLVRDGLQRWSKGSPPPRTQMPRTSNAFWKALGLSLTNPKAILFFVAFFTQFVRPDAPSLALAYLILGVVVIMLSMTYLSLLIVAGAKLQERFHAHPRWASLGLWTVGLCFIGFAATMLVR